jgi:IQ calmodulin-binding motif
MLCVLVGAGGLEDSGVLSKIFVENEILEAIRAVRRSYGHDSGLLFVVHQFPPLSFQNPRRWWDCQAAFRGWLARKNKREWLRRRMRSTVVIQSAMRSKLARVWFRREKRFLDHAALDIQRVWRS